MRISAIAAQALVLLAIGLCLLRGTIGWFVVGFGVMTDCTNTYDCSSVHCSPCLATQAWIDVGGLTQLLMVGVGIGMLVRGTRARSARRLALGGAGLLLASVLVFSGTTWLAQRSSCSAGGPGHDATCAGHAGEARTAMGMAGSRDAGPTLVAVD